MYLVTERFSTHKECWKTEKVFYQLCKIFGLGRYGRMMTIRKREVMCEMIAILKMKAASYIYIYIFFFLFFLAQQSSLGQGFLILDVSRSHTTTHHSR
jgi:hypothetical protein